MIKPETIKAYRKAAKLNQKEFAQESGISHAKARLTWEKDGIPDERIKEAKAIINLLEFQEKNR